MKYIALTSIFALVLTSVTFAQKDVAEPQFVEMGIERHTIAKLCPKPGMTVGIYLTTAGGRIIRTFIDPREKGEKDINPAVQSFTTRIQNPEGNLQLTKGFTVQVTLPDGTKETFQNLKPQPPAPSIIKADYLSLTYVRDESAKKGRIEID